MREGGGRKAEKTEKWGGGGGGGGGGGRLSAFPPISSLSRIWVLGSFPI